MTRILVSRLLSVVGVIVLSTTLVVSELAIADDSAVSTATPPTDLQSYVNAMRSHIQRHWAMPAKHEGLSCHALILQNEQGEVLAAQVKECASPELSASIERAVYKASPLPLPQYPEHFRRAIKLQFVVTGR